MSEYSNLYMNSFDYQPTNLKGKIKSVFALDIGGINYATDITSFKLKSQPLPPERVTFGKYSRGAAVEWTLDITAVFEGGSEGSLHDFLWDYPGYTTQFLIRPFQEFDPNDRRFFGGYMRIPNRPDIKVKAGEFSTFDYTFKVVGQPVRTERPLGIVTGKVYSEI